MGQQEKNSIRQLKQCGFKDVENIGVCSMW